MLIHREETFLLLRMEWMRAMAEMLARTLSFLDFFPSGSNGDLLCTQFMNVHCTI